MRFTDEKSLWDVPADIGTRKTIWAKKEAIHDLRRTGYVYTWHDVRKWGVHLPQSEDYDISMGYPNAVFMGKCVVRTLETTFVEHVESLREREGERQVTYRTNIC